MNRAIFYRPMCTPTSNELEISDYLSEASILQESDRSTELLERDNSTCFSSTHGIVKVASTLIKLHLYL